MMKPLAKANPKLAWKNTYDLEMPALGNSGSQWIFLEIYLTVLKISLSYKEVRESPVKPTNNNMVVRQASKNYLQMGW